MIMKNDGFALTDALIWLLVIFVFSLIAIVMGRRTLATSLTGVTEASDSEIYLATERYVEDGNVNFDNDYFCISTNTLINSGYLRNTLSKNRYVEVKVNKLMKVVEEEHIVSNCNY